MTTPIVGDIINNVFDIFKGYIARKFPDPAQRAKEEQELREYLEQMDQAQIQQFFDFVVNYEGAGDKVTPWLQNYRGSVRPTVTYGLIAAFVYGVFNNIQDVYIDLLYKLNLISMGFWYGERALKNLNLDLRNMFQKGSK